MNEILYAKSDGTRLDNHTKMVINVGMALANKYTIFNKYGEIENNERQEFLNSLAIALMTHDIGKITDGFQNYIKDEKNAKNCEFIPHNIASYCFMDGMLKKGIDGSLDESITAPVLFHHSYTRENEKSNSRKVVFNSHELENMKNFFNEMKTYVSNTFENVDLSCFNLRQNYNKVTLPQTSILFTDIDLDDIKVYHETIKEESFKQLIRAILVKSDRIVSSHDCMPISEKILNNDIDTIYDLIQQDSMISDKSFHFDFEKRGYDSDRLSIQRDILKDTEMYSHNVVNASAGFGKTLIGLMWFEKLKEKVLWASPRNTLCCGNYESINRELVKLGMEKSVKVCLVYGGKIQRANDTEDLDHVDIMNYDIIVLNIDSMLNRFTNNNIGHLLFNMFTSNIIFDEYHEFVQKEGGLYGAFVRLMMIRSNNTLSKTLMLSATPSNLDCLWGENTVNYISKRNILHEDTRYNIRFIEINDNGELIDNYVVKQDKSTAILAKTISDSQEIYRGLEKTNENWMLLHSLFTKDDKDQKLLAVLKEHGKENIHGENKHSVVATNVVGTGLDISFHRLYDFIISHETTIQRACGRMNRFGEFDEVDYNVCVLKDSKFNPYDNTLTRKWIEILKEYNGECITRKKLYDLYDKFIADNEEELDDYYKSCFNKSSEALSELELWKTSHKKNKNSNRDALSSRNNFRGKPSSIYVIAKLDGDVNTFSDSIIIDDERINLDNESEHDKERKTCMIELYKKEISKGEWKYKWGVNSFSLSELNSVGKIYPIPLYTKRYSKKFGLYDSKQKSER